MLQLTFGMTHPQVWLHAGETDIINRLKVMGPRFFTVGGGSQEHETRKTRINLRCLISIRNESKHMAFNLSV